MAIDCLRKYNLVYLASPYSGFPDGIEAAFAEVADIAGQLIKEGISVFSPIAHSHMICEYAGLDHYSHDLWMRMDEPFMRAADAICVVQMEGWAKSKGVGLELFHFKVQNKPAFLLDPDLFICEPF